MVSYQHFSLDGRPLDGPPLRAIEAYANQPGNASSPFETAPLREDGLVAMRLPALPPPGPRGRPPDSFYERVAAFVRLCDEHGIADGPRLAVDNEVPTTTVYRWVREARRRGVLNGAEER